MFSEDGSVSRDLLQEHLTPGALDAFLNGGLDPDENSMGIDGGEEGGLFTIPKVLLVDMPIAEITPNTKIVHLGKPDGPANIQSVPQPMEDVYAPPPPEPRAGTSGVTLGPFHEAMEVEVEVQATPTPNLAASLNPVTPATVPGTTKNVQARIPQEGKTMARSTAQPKKGTNIKNKKGNTKSPTQADPTDDTVKERMSILKKITELMQASYGSRRNEMEVWGHYVGLKAGRLPVGRKRDKVLVRVEELLNEATYGDDQGDE